ncbi:MAG: glutamine-hydrolyzing GMP synthase [Thermoguttaceae bacterium]|nr:glutamine-hydrolyzing GMP synthase [Thermoguttaceae bacterium]
MGKELIVVLDFGGQYNQLIARRVRDLNVYAEVVPYTVPLSELKAMNPKGIIFTGGPNSVYLESSPRYTREILDAGIPILGICYGAQLMAYMEGGKIAHAPVGEYGRTEMTVRKPGSRLWNGIPQKSVCWMSHTDFISEVPPGFEAAASTADCPCAAIENEERRLYAVQFHPEVSHTACGTALLKNFLFGICRCAGDWKMDDFVEETVASLRERIGGHHVVLGLSGGVDSSVAAALLSRAVGKRLTCVFVDHGLMRKDEGDFVERTFTSLFDMNFVRINAAEQFFFRLKGLTDPEDKRKAIGEEFYRVFWDNIRENHEKGFFAQGTIYPDYIESGSGHAQTIKTHHNEVKKPKDIKFLGVIEPLRLLFKDEVRRVGLRLGLPEDLVWRQPFPGPGLGVRVIGEVTAERVAILQEADAVLRDEMKKSGYEREAAQFFAILPGVRTVGVMGDHRTYSEQIAVRAVTTDDFMTADWAKIPYDLLGRISNRIINEVEQVNRVVYDITSKPPGTVEWE